MSDLLTKQVKEIIANELNVPMSKLTDSASFQEDLGADSLAIIELIMRIEEAFDLDIPDKEAETIRTVKEAIAYVKTKKG
jgi:acyl carrier protein